MEISGNNQVESLYKSGCEKMKLPCADETQPFKEKYEAKGLFEICFALQPPTDLKGQLVRALCLYRMGLVAYDTEEITVSQTHMLESLKIWQSLPESVQYNHATTL